MVHAVDWDAEEEMNEGAEGMEAEVHIGALILPVDLKHFGDKCHIHDVVGYILEQEEASRYLVLILGAYDHIYSSFGENQDDDPVESASEEIVAAIGVLQILAEIGVGTLRA